MCRSMFTILLISLVSAGMLFGLEGRKLYAQERHVTHFLYTPNANGLPIVQVRLNDTQTANFLLDTGCTYSFISAEITQKMGLTTAPANTSDGMPLRINGIDMQAVEVQRLQRSGR